MTIVSRAADALEVIGREPIRAVLVEHPPGGAAGERSLRSVVEVAEAVAAGVSGAFYRDQLGPELLSAIDRLALGTASDLASLPAGEHLRRAVAIV